MLCCRRSVLAATEGATASADRGIYDVLIPLIVLLPILGFAFTALFGRRLQMRFGARRGGDRADRHDRR